MAKYRKKPVEVEAFKYDGDLKGKHGWYVPDWAIEASEKGILFYSNLVEDLPPCELFIRTARGRVHVHVGDYVVLAPDGALHPCRAGIFEEAYDLVTEEETR